VTTASGAPDATPSARPVTVVPTYYGWDAASTAVLMGGYVNGVQESGGVCTLTLTRGGTSVHGSSTARPNASTTACAEISVPGSKLSAGRWRGVLSYRSPRAAGSSAPVSVVVP
jgi:hypothetical protein